MDKNTIALRIKKHLTTREVAHVLGINQVHVAYYIKKEMLPIMVELDLSKFGVTDGEQEKDLSDPFVYLVDPQLIDDSNKDDNWQPPCIAASQVSIVDDDMRYSLFARKDNGPVMVKFHPWEIRIAQKDWLTFEAEYFKGEQQTNADDLKPAERDRLMLTIAALLHRMNRLPTSSQGTLEYNGRLSAERVKATVLNELENHMSMDTEGLKTLNETLSDAIKLANK